MCLQSAEHHSSQAKRILNHGHMALLFCCQQEFRKCAAMCVTLITIGKLVFAPPKEGANADQRKADFAKALQFSATLGLSKADLPPDLLSKTENWVATGDPAKPSEIAEPAKAARKRTASNQDKVAKKQRQKPQAESGRKRKKN